MKKQINPINNPKIKGNIAVRGGNSSSSRKVIRSSVRSCDSKDFVGEDLGIRLIVKFKYDEKSGSNSTK